MTGRTGVLVVDELTETTDVLRAILEPRGLSVRRASGITAEPSIPPTAAAPDEPEVALVVVDAETAAWRNLPVSAWQHMPRVVIGTIHTTSDAARLAEGAGPLRCLRKPFQYAELLQAIESLIGDERGPAVRERAA